MDNDGDGQNSEGIQFQPNKTEIFLVILVKDSLSLLCLIVLSLLYILSLAFSFPTEQESLFFFKLLWSMDGHYNTPLSLSLSKTLFQRFFLGKLSLHLSFSGLCMEVKQCKTLLVW